MSNIILISRPDFLARDPVTNKLFHRRISARLRGEEVASYLGSKYNDYESEGIRIFIKPRNLRNVKDGEYVDLIDGIELIPALKERPKIKVIAMSKVHYDYLRKELPNELFLIPHHHINFEKKTRVKNENLVGGIIGPPSKWSYEVYKKIKKELAKVGIDFTYSFHYHTREEMVNYYLSIDFLVIWYDETFDRNCYWRHPTKIINAASFGIPTLTKKILGHQEMEGFYIPIEEMDDLVTEAVKLKDQNYYQAWSDKIVSEANKYHISQIAKLYKKL